MYNIHNNPRLLYTYLHTRKTLNAITSVWTTQYCVYIYETIIWIYIGKHDA